MVLKKFGNCKNLELCEVPIPIPKPHEVRIKVVACGFNPVDCKIRQGLIRGQTPLILGTDCSGIIDAVGSDVQSLSIGDEVFAMTYGACSNGSYAEYLCIAEKAVVKKPKKLSFSEAAVIPLVSMTAYRAMIASSAIKKGDILFIAGIAGGVGSFAVQLAKLAQVEAIYTVAGSNKSAEFIQNKLGINENHILLYPNQQIENLKNELIAINNGQLFNAAFDFVGGEMKKLCLSLTGYSGHFATLLPENEEFDFPILQRGISPAFARSLSMHFVNVAAESHSENLELLNVYQQQLSIIANLYEKDVLKPLQSTNVGNFSLETVVLAHQLLESGRVKGKLLMTF